MTPHSRIPPYIVRTGASVSLVVAMEPAGDELVPSLQVPLDRRTGLRLLADLHQALWAVWEPEITGSENKSRTCDRATP